MKEFAAFVRKEFRHILRDKRTMLIVLIMPVVQMILFGYAVRTEIEHARVDIVGDVSDPEVRRIVDSMLRAGLRGEAPQDGPGEREDSG